MYSLRRSLVTSFIFAIVIAAADPSSAQSWTPEMQVKLNAPGSPMISPDKARVVYTVNEAVMTADKSEFVTQIWMASTDGTDDRQMTYGEKSSTNPKWSPDGKTIAFTSNRKDNRNYIYLLRVSGGEAEQLTEIKGSVANFDWSPDGRSIAFTMTDPKSEDEEKMTKAVMIFGGWTRISSMPGYLSCRSKKLLTENAKHAG
jgi:Periplasmic component of the Tol biopolymer transport system